MTTLKEDILIQKILLCDKDAELSELKKELLNIKVAKIRLFTDAEEILKQIEKGNLAILRQYSLKNEYSLKEMLINVIHLCDKGLLRDTLIRELIKVQEQPIWKRFIENWRFINESL